MRLVHRAKKVLLRGIQWVVVPIRGGPLKGKWWTVSSSVKFIRGTFESKRLTAFRNHVKSGHVVYDIGAHMGYYTLIAAEAVGDSGRVFSFEPLPFNLQQLRRHIKINGCKNVTVMDAAVGEHAGVARFAAGPGTGTSRISAEGELQVRVVALDDLLGSGAIPPPDSMKVDVEGSELAVLKGGANLIAATHPLIFLSCHGEKLKEQCSCLLTAWGYHEQETGLWLPPAPPG